MAALTIGMATYDDFDGVYFTVQALRLYHDLADTELLVIDNFGCETTRDFVETWAKGRYILATAVVGTAASRDLLFREGEGEAVVASHPPDDLVLAAAVSAEADHLVTGTSTCSDWVLMSVESSSVPTHSWRFWLSNPR